MLMSEIMPIVSALRLPVVMPEVNRAISGPINIHCDHSDTMFTRDAGWIQIFSENSQEAYDNVLQAIKIAEHPEVSLPALVTTDGFIISHLMEGINMIDDDTAKEYIGPYKAAYALLDTDKPITVGSLDLQNYYFEHKYPVAQAMRAAKKVILEVGKDLRDLLGRHNRAMQHFGFARASYHGDPALRASRVDGENRRGLAGHWALTAAKWMLSILSESAA